MDLKRHRAERLSRDLDNQNKMLKNKELALKIEERKINIKFKQLELSKEEYKESLEVLALLGVLEKRLWDKYRITPKGYWKCLRYSAVKTKTCLREVRNQSEGITGGACSTRRWRQKPTHAF